MSLSPEDMKRVGGSDVAAIVGVSPYAGPLSVYLRIVEGVEREGGAHTDRGNRLEEPVLGWYEETTGRKVVRKVSMRDNRRPHLRASPDALSWGGEDQGSPARPVEVKTANLAQAPRWGEEGTDAIPPEYLCQAHWYLGLGRDVRGDVDNVCDVPALIAGDFRLYSVAHCAETYGLLSEAVDRFWVDHVLARRPPEPTTLSNDLEAVQRRFRRHDGDRPLDFAALPPEAQVTLEEYLRAYAEESTAAERLALWEVRAKMALGAAPGVAGLPPELGFTRLDWKKNRDGTATDWKQVAEAMRDGVPFGAAVEQYTTTREGSRPFTPRAIAKGKR